MNRLQFEPNRHRYTLDDKPITGVTTILGVIAKPALINWSANMAVDYIKNNLKRDDLITQKDFDLVLSEARKAHTRKRDKAGDIGTAVHGECENWIRAEYLKLKPKENPEYNEVSDKNMADKMIKHFKDWAIKNKVKFIASERQVFSEKYFFCGTYDFLCELDGKIWLGDIKTSNGIYPEFFFQCAGYQICEEEMDGTKIDGHIIVNLKKDGKFDEKRSVSNKNNKTAFLSALNLYRIINNVAGRTL